MKKVQDLVQTSMFIALVFLATSSVRVPVVPGAGLIHTGTVILFIVACAFGPLKGALAGSLGMALFNLTTEWAVWAPYTFVIRFVMGLIIGSIAYSQGRKGRSWKMNLLALFISALWFLPTTYIAQMMIQGIEFGDWRIPLLALPGNLAQLALALVIGLPAIPRIAKLRDTVLYKKSRRSFQ
ncbi:MAG: ECF transporter S component [Turicibacter sp.]|nr:ECF transporter S component [Turicibacter sp.]